MIVVFNATFNNISVISLRSVLLVEETGELGENDRPVASHWQSLSRNVEWSTPERNSNSQLEWWYALIAKVVVFPTIIRSRPRCTQRWRESFNNSFYINFASNYVLLQMYVYIVIVMKYQNMSNNCNICWKEQKQISF